jgi:hypothetical protein
MVCLLFWGWHARSLSQLKLSISRYVTKDVQEGRWIENIVTCCPKSTYIWFQFPWKRDFIIALYNNGDKRPIVSVVTKSVDSPVLEGVGLELRTLEHCGPVQWSCCRTNINDLQVLFVSRVAQLVQRLATGWKTGRSWLDSLQRQRISPLTSVSRPALEPIQIPVQCVPEVLSPGLKRGRGVTLTTHPHLVPISRMIRSHTASTPAAP